MSLHTLMFGWEYPPANCGGLGVACQGIVRGLLQSGAKVTLVLPHSVGSEQGADILYPTDEQISHVRMAIPSMLQAYDSDQAYAERYALLRQSTRIPSDIQSLYGSDLGAEVERFTAVAVEVTRDIHPDVVHAHDWMTLEAGAIAATYHHVPFVAHVHATELDRTEFHPNPVIYQRERAGLLRADHVIAVSGYTKQLLSSEYGIPSDNISVLHNGTFNLATSIATRRLDHHPLVLFLGRLTVQKGVPYFLKAARQIANVQPDVRFVVAGEGYLLPELTRMAYDFGLADRVLFAGRVSQGEAIALYKRADCFVMPSVSEPFGLVALEAIENGAPVVLSKQSGASEVVRNAFAVDFWDTDKMADCILTVLREQPLVDQMRSETPHILGTLTWKRQGGKILSIYNNIIHH